GGGVPGRRGGLRRSEGEGALPDGDVAEESVVGVEDAVGGAAGGGEVLVEDREFVVGRHVPPHGAGRVRGAGGGDRDEHAERPLHEVVLAVGGQVQAGPRFDPVGQPVDRVGAAVEDPEPGGALGGVRQVVEADRRALGVDLGVVQV